MYLLRRLRYEKALPVFHVGYGAGRFFSDAAFEREVPVMFFHLSFQFLPGSGNGTESGEVASVHMETEPVDAYMVWFSHEKEIPGMADRSLDIHVV